MKNKIKLLVGVIVSSIVIIWSIMTSLSILKDEAINNYLTISKLNSSTFSKEINQDLINIEQIITNLSSLLELENTNLNINKKLFDTLKNYPQIRSINILRNERIIYSSNKNNKHLIINSNNFFPTPLFDEEILKISTPWIGRDFANGKDIYTHKNNITDSSSFFIPISKKIDINGNQYNIIVNLNNDYFINRFLTNLKEKHITIELIRLDGILLLSTNNKQAVGKKIERIDLLETSIENNGLTEIVTIHDVKYILTYMITDNYPIAISIKFDYEKNLINWNNKQSDFFIVTSFIVILSILIALISFYFYNKKREEEIKLHKIQIEDQKKFKLLFQNSHYISAIISQTGDILDLNNASLKFLDESIKNVKTKKLWQLNCWRYIDKKKVKSYILNNNGKRIQNEIIILDKYKNERIIECSLSFINLENEKILIALGLDITDKKNKEVKLKQAYTVFNNTRDGIMITNQKTEILDVNKAFEKITGYKKKQVLNKRTSILKSNFHTSQFYESMWKSINDNGYWEGEITNITRDNKLYTEWLTINIIYEKNKTIKNYIGIFSDITEQKVREKLLKEKDENLYQQSKMAAMGEMIGNIAHQWRQPLSLISSASTGILLQKEFGVSNIEDEKKSLESINKSAQYLSQTIEDFRNFLKIDKELNLFNLKEAIFESTSLLNMDNKNSNIKLEIEVDNKLSIYGIRNEFIQVLINLLKNSKDAFIPNLEHKVIFININKTSQYIFITVKDNAGGIPSKIIDRIFEPYFTTKHQSQGTGIGLYMSEEIIKNHFEGQLIVENETFIYKDIEYSGAKFIIRVPFR